jgi:hypothetical protein
MNAPATVLALLLAVALPAVSAAADIVPAPGAAPPAPGLPNFVQLGSIQGLPSDSLVRGSFMAGFRGQFADELVPGERQSGAGEWERSAPVSNRFKWLEGDPASNSWRLDVVIGSPPAVVLKSRGTDPGRRALETRRRSRGMIAALTVQAPETGGNRPPPVQQRFAFAFPAGAADSSGAMSVPGIGYVFPWNEAGRVVAKLALDMLHHQRGDMDPGERLVIAPALRAEAGR